MRFTLYLLALLFLLPHVAHAHYVVWGDAEMQYHFSYPDMWKEQGGLPGDARVRVLAPNIPMGGDGATCTIFAKHDKRYTIYPRDYLVKVVAQEVNWGYWEQAVANYDDLYFYYDNYGALGAGDARYTLVDYIDRSGVNPLRKRAMVFATIYADLHMMVHCSAPIKAFDAYAADFGQIVDSIQFEPRYTPTYRSDYRDFLETKEYNHHWYEPIVMFFYPLKTMAAVINCPRSEDYYTCSSKLKPPPIRTR